MLDKLSYFLNRVNCIVDNIWKRDKKNIIFRRQKTHESVNIQQKERQTDEKMKLEKS